MLRTLWACALAVCLGQMAAAQGQSDLAQAAKLAYSAGKIEMARMLALAALKDDPWSPTALSVLAGVGVATGEPEAARIVAAQSFDAAKDPGEKFTAARLAARASVDLKQYGAAKYWLRRAVQEAPTDAAREATINDFLKVRALSPLKLDFDLSIRPSDNVNQGAQTRMLVVDGQPTWFVFDGSALALSGVESAATVSGRYRLGGTIDAPTELGFRLYHRDVQLSDKSKRLAPTIRGADLASSAADLSLWRTFRPSDRSDVKLGATWGRTWLAGKAYSDRTRIEGSLSTRHSAALKTRLGFALEKQRLATGKPAATAVTVDGGLTYEMARGNTLAFRIEANETASKDRNQDQRRLSASVRYVLGEPLAGAKVSAGLSMTARDFPVFFNGVFNDTGRQDRTVTSSVDVGLPKLGVFGFEPVVSVEASRTRSNISRYESQTVGIGLRIQSSF